MLFYVQEGHPMFIRCARHSPDLYVPNIRNYQQFYNFLLKIPVKQQCFCSSSLPGFLPLFHFLHFLLFLTFYNNDGFITFEILLDSGRKWTTGMGPEDHMCTLCKPGITPGGTAGITPGGTARITTGETAGITTG